MPLKIRGNRSTQVLGMYLSQSSLAMGYTYYEHTDCQERSEGTVETTNLETRYIL